MIVKNEAKLIRRCLESVRPLVDFICICDTGSTDETQSIIAEYIMTNKMRGVIYEEPWQDFATNRNLAIEGLSRADHIDYAFMIDADDTLSIAPEFNIAAFKAGMTLDVYDVGVSHGNVVHDRPQIWRNKPGYKWVGVLHEYLDPPKPFTRGKATGLTINASIEGSRNADPLKFQKDAEILENALKTEKNEYLRARYTFYLAQSYRDANNPEQARKYYKIRADMGLWDQEVYVSLTEAIRACTALGGEAEYNACQGYLNRASALGLKRAEHFHAMSFLCRQLGRNDMGMEVARNGLNLTTPDGLFIQPWIYDYGLRDEYAVNAYWCGHYLECLQACINLLQNPKLPPDAVKRIADNARVSLDKLTPRFVSNTSLVFSD
jgi:glycosyltransferase involved in cell wall biosynthesis